MFFKTVALYLSCFCSFLLWWVSTLTLRSGKKLLNASNTCWKQRRMEEGKHFLCPEGRLVDSGCFPRECESACGLIDSWSSGSCDHRTGQWVWLIPPEMSTYTLQFRTSCQLCFPFRYAQLYLLSQRLAALTGSLPIPVEPSYRPTYLINLSRFILSYFWVSLMNRPLTKKKKSPDASRLILSCFNAWKCWIKEMQ